MARAFHLAAAAASRTARLAGWTAGLRRPVRTLGRRPRRLPLGRWPGWMLAGLGGAAAAGLLLLLLFRDADNAGGGFDRQEHLELTPDDADPESTALVQRLLEDNQLDGRLALALVREARLTGAGLQGLSPALTEGSIPPALAPAARTLRDALANGGACVYTVWVQAADPGTCGSVALALDGYSLGRFSLGLTPIPLSLVLRTECPAHLRFRALSAARQVVALRGRTAAIAAVTGKLRPGQSGEWVLTAVR